jgi:hypothetical protein
LLQQALVLEVAAPAGGGGDGASSAELRMHGAGGLLPNLDLYYLIKRNLDLHTSLPVGLKDSGVLPAAVRRGLDAAARAAAAAAAATPAAAARYASELQTLAGFAAQQASGRGDGGHAPFLARQVDGATLALRLPAAAARGPLPGSPKAQQRAAAAATAALTATEMVLRTFNNLEERLHHSTALYALVAPSRFVSVGAYLAPPGAALLAALAQASPGVGLQRGVRGGWLCRCGPLPLLPLPGEAPVGAGRRCCRASIGRRRWHPRCQHMGGGCVCPFSTPPSRTSPRIHPAPQPVAAGGRQPGSSRCHPAVVARSRLASGMAPRGGSPRSGGGCGSAVQLVFQRRRLARPAGTAAPDRGRRLGGRSGPAGRAGGGACAWRRSAQQPCIG